MGRLFRRPPTGEVEGEIFVPAEAAFFRDVVAGVVRMNKPLFFTMIVLGRGLQSWVILAGLTSAFH